MKKKILVAPLNSGLGHAARCIPIIDALEEHDYEPVIASDGTALALLQKEFPHLTALELPAYKLEYAKNWALFEIKIFNKLTQMLKAIRREQEWVQKIVKVHNIEGIISDNRLGICCRDIPSVFMTHQLSMFTGSTSWLTTAVHRMFIRRYRECWVPDAENTPNLSGKLGHVEDESLKLKYIGPLSRMHKQVTEKKYDLMVILSGPEPQRSLLEQKLTGELEGYTGKTLFVRGVIEAEEQVTTKGNITFYNFMNTGALERAFNGSEVILCRPGYTTIMDLAHLCKKAFFIPSPGQYEQEYLAKKLKKLGIAPYATEKSFSIEDLQEVPLYKGLKSLTGAAKWKDLFCLFEGK